MYTLILGRSGFQAGYTLEIFKLYHFGPVVQRRYSHVIYHQGVQLGYQTANIFGVQLMFSKWIVVFATVKCYLSFIKAHHGVCFGEMANLFLKTNSM